MANRCELEHPNYDNYLLQAERYHLHIYATWSVTSNIMQNATFGQLPHYIPFIAHCSWSIGLLHVSTVSVYIFTSSANNFSLTPNLFQCSIKSSVKTRNNSGPIPLPWTMPLVRFATFENYNPTWVWCVLRKCPIQRSRQPLMPHEASLSRSLLWTTLSKALLKSTYTASYTEQKKSSYLSFP